MLTINIKGRELFNEMTNEFITINSRSIQLEHSLVSISKWESKWKKPFLSKKSMNEKMTNEEFLDYIKCMTVTTNVDDNVYMCLTQKDIKTIGEYINDPMTATTISNKNKKNSNEVITAEIIYYWMISLGIPFECQKWHLNKLLMLIDVCSVKESPGKKMSVKDILASNKALNASRRASLHTRG